LLPRFRGRAWFGNALELLELLELLMHAVAMGRPRETVQNEEELARLCRTAVMAIEREDDPGARWARMRLGSRNGMLVSTLFLMR
jgi:hypothetical protein